MGVLASFVALAFVARAHSNAGFTTHLILLDLGAVTHPGRPPFELVYAVQPVAYWT